MLIGMLTPQVLLEFIDPQECVYRKYSSVFSFSGCLIGLVESRVGIAMLVNGRVRVVGPNIPEQVNLLLTFTRSINLVYFAEGYGPVPQHTFPAQCTVWCRRGILVFLWLGEVTVCSRRVR